MFHSTGFRPWVLVVRRMLTLRTTYVRHKKKLLPATARDKSWQKWLKVLLHKEKTFYLTRVLKVPLTNDILYIQRLCHTKELLEHVLNKKFSLNDAVSSVIFLYELVGGRSFLCRTYVVRSVSPRRTLYLLYSETERNIGAAAAVGAGNSSRGAPVGGGVSVLST